jgi:predicted ATPase
VFISYRREDSAGWTGRIYDRACAQLGSDHVFLDVEVIGPGDDFVRTIGETLERVDFVVVVIGPRWLEVTDTDGRRRLDDHSDYVRREIAVALDRDVRVVPVLVNGARMPAGADLPREIKPLSTRNAVAISDTRFDRDIGRLLDTLGRVDPGLAPEETPPHNLPSQLTPFIGRTEQIRTAKRLLEHERLVSLLGPGGSGKTRLALEIAADGLYRYEDGAWFIDFRQVDDPAGVTSLIATAMRVVATGEGPLTDQVIEALWPRRLLLIFDNCEHILGAVAPFAERLLARGGDVRILATSRAPLGVPGETTMLVPPLRVPESPELDRLRDSEAVRLFADRARSARETFSLNDHLDAVFDVCQAVEGLPLALELAAARLRMASPEEVADRLGDQLRLLRASSKAGDTRHATIEATIRWSWDLLDDSERVLFGRLSAFRGTWALEAAEGICGFEPIAEDQVFDLLGRLVEKSLVDMEQVSRGSTRYRMLEPLRQFAAGQLDEQNTEQLRARCVDYWSTSLSPTWEHPDAIGEFYESAWALEPDQANLTAAVEWAFDSEQFDDAMKIFGSPFGQLMRLQASSVVLVGEWMDRALEHRRLISPDVLYAALDVAISIVAQAFQNEAWLAYAEVAGEIAQTPQQRLYVELGVAIATNRLGREEEAGELFDRVFSEATDPGLRASALVFKSQGLKPKEKWLLARQIIDLAPLESLGFADESFAAWIVATAAATTGRYDLAAEMAARSLETSRRWRYAVMAGFSAVQVAGICCLTGRLDEAAEVMAEAVPAARRILGPNITRVTVLREAAGIARLQGDLETARRLVEEAEQAGGHSDDPDDQIHDIRESALIARDDGDLGLAAHLLDKAARLVDENGLHDYLLTPIHEAFAGVELRRADPDVALTRLHDFLSETDRLAHFRIVTAVEMVGIALAQRRTAGPGARLLGAVDVERERTGLVGLPPDRLLREAADEQCRTLLRDDWGAATTEGREMSLDEAVDYAKGLLATSVD